VVNLALSKYCSIRANQPELPTVFCGVENHQGSTVDPDNIMDYGFAHGDLLFASIVT
jgi:maltooligosyltrehalose synthase